MSRSLTLLLAGTLITTAAAAASATDLAQFLMPDRAAEIALARTAAPRSISDSATVLVLTHDGYVEAARGTNGFVCLVARAFEGSLTDTASWWNLKTVAPHCLNPAAVRTVLPEMERRAALVMQGTPANDVVAKIAGLYAEKKLVDPEDGAMAYMLSHDQVLGEQNSHWMPHVMFYYGGGHKGAEWGAAGPDAPIMDGGTDPNGVTVILIPVPKWSDGTPAGGH